MKSTETHILPLSEYFNAAPGVNAREYLLHLLVVGEFYHTPGYNITRANYNSFQLIIVREGEFIVEIDDQIFVGHTNDIFILDCYRQHRFRSNTGSRSLWIHFDGPAARGYYNVIIERYGHVFSTSAFTDISNAVQEIFDVYKSGDSIDDIRMSRILTDILCSLIENGSAQTEEVPPELDTLQKLLSSINEDLVNPPTVHAMAEGLGFSDAYFIRLFSKTTGMTPKQYIVTARIDRAKVLLQSTTLSIQDIGSMVGYNSESMFSTMFKRMTDMTPREYRKRKITYEFPPLVTDIQRVSDAVLHGDPKEAAERTQTAIRNRNDPQAIINALMDATATVGDLFSRHEIFISEMLSSARAVHESLVILMPFIAQDRQMIRGKVIIGTVEGDQHDIGKNLVATMLRASGFEVTDLGVDVTPQKFNDALSGAPDTQIVCVSALLTTSLPWLKETVRQLNSSPFRSSFKIMVGGAAVTREIAEECGADAYTSDAAAAARKACELVRNPAH